jgi:hypothetical protein
MADAAYAQPGQSFAYHDPYTPGSAFRDQSGSPTAVVNKVGTLVPADHHRDATTGEDRAYDPAGVTYRGRYPLEQFVSADPRSEIMPLPPRKPAR